MYNSELLLKKVLIGLDTLDAAYHFVLPDGAEFRSEKPLVPPNQKKKRFVDPNRIKNGPYFDEKIGDMKVGECRDMAMQEGDDFNRFCANAGAYCANHFRPKDAPRGVGVGVYYSLERNVEEKSVTIYRFQ